MFAFTIFVTYLGAGAALLTRLSDAAERDAPRNALLWLLVVAIALHGGVITNQVLLNPAHGLDLIDVLSVISWLLAAIGLFAAMQPGFRALAGAVFIVSAALLLIDLFLTTHSSEPLSWQIKLHAVLSLVAYSFLAAGALLAVVSLVQDRQLRAARVTRLSSLLPPLLATEKFLATLTTSGFVFLLLSVTSGFIFVENLLSQNLTHKTTLSLIALVIFGALVIGRRAVGWRGKRMMQLYLAGFAVLVLAYFGSKFVLEVLLNRQWG